MPAQFSRDDFDWGPITELYWDLVLDPEKPLELQLDGLKEDLIQAAYVDGTVLDVGWYPSFQASGRFVTSVIRDYDWEDPVLRVESRSIPSLRDAITAALAVARPQT